MYKALFELSADRVEFVSRLFSLKRPAGLTHKSTAQEIFAAFADRRSEDLFKQNADGDSRLLSKKDRLGLSADDLKGIEDIYREFYTRGLDIHYEITPGSDGAFPTYPDLMTATDTASWRAASSLGRELPDRQGPRSTAPGGAGGRQLRRPEGHPRDRQVPAVARRVVSASTSRSRAVSRPGRRPRGVLCQRGDAAGGRLEHVHPQRARWFRPARGSRRARTPGFAGNFSSQLHNIASERRARVCALRRYRPRALFNRNARRRSTKLFRLRSASDVGGERLGSYTACAYPP